MFSVVARRVLRSRTLTRQIADSIERTVYTDSRGYTHFNSGPGARQWGKKVRESCSFTTLSRPEE